MFDIGTRLDNICNYCSITGGQTEETLSNQASDGLQIYNLGISEELPIYFRISCFQKSATFIHYKEGLCLLSEKIVSQESKNLCAALTGE